MSLVNRTLRDLERRRARVAPAPTVPAALRLERNAVGRWPLRIATLAASALAALAFITLPRDMLSWRHAAASQPIAAVSAAEAPAPAPALPPALPPALTRADLAPLAERELLHGNDLLARDGDPWRAVRIAVALATTETGTAQAQQQRTDVAAPAVGDRAIETNAADGHADAPPAAQGAVAATPQDAPVQRSTAGAGGDASGANDRLRRNGTGHAPVSSAAPTAAPAAFREPVIPPDWSADAAAHEAAPAPATAAGQTPQFRLEPHRADPAAQADDDYAAAITLIRAGRESEAQQRLTQLLAASPWHSAARAMLVDSLIEEGRLDRARQLLDEGEHAAPGDVDLAGARARWLVRQQRVPEAIALLRNQASSPGNAAGLALLAGLLQTTGDHAGAVQAYQSALATEPRNGTWWTGLGISLQALQLNRQALQAFRQARASSELAAAVRSFVDERIAGLESGRKS